MWNNSSEEVTTNQYFLSSSRICDTHVENCAQAGTIREQTDQNFVKNEENSRNQKQHHLSEKVKLFTAAILSATKETITRGRRRDYIPGWNAQLKELTVLPANSEKMEFCPTDDNITAYDKAKAEFTRQKLQQTRAALHERTSSSTWKKDTSKLWKLT